MKKQIFAPVISTISFVVFSLSSVYASGFALNTQSAEALGAAAAGAQATQGKPSNAYFNPASIVGVEGWDSSLSIVAVIHDTSFENANGVLLGTVPVQGDNRGEDVIGDGAFPTGAVAVKLNDHLYAGLAAYVPFGFNSSYEETTVTRYQGTFSQVISGALSPIVGVSLGNSWSIAAGPKFQYLDFDSDGAIDAAGIEAASFMTASIPGTDDIFFEFDADDWSVGYTVGLQGDLAEWLHFGASFSSKVTHQLRGMATFDLAGSTAGQTLALGAGLFQDTAISTELTTPATLQFGLIADVGPSTRLMASAVQTRWSSFDSLVTVFDNALQPPEPSTHNQQNVWSGSVGAEIDLSRSSTLRGGLMYEDDPVNPAFSTARVPGAKRLWVAAGYSKQLSERARLHLAASYILTDDTPVQQSGALPENLFRGALSQNVNINAVVAGIGIDWDF